MKKHIITLFAASLAMAACTAEIEPQKEAPSPAISESFVPGPEAFTAFAEGDPGSKAVIGLNDSSKPQTFWEDGDQIVVYSSGLSTSGTVTGFKFSTSLADNATSATFAYDDERTDWASGDYLATYPYRADARGVNYTREGDVYKVAAVDVPKSQTLVAGTFDRKACPAVAYAAEGSTSLSFRNAAAMLKFRVAEANIVAGQIVVDEADAISGRFRADIDINTLIPELSKYNQPNYNYIDFTIDGSTPLATGTDYYVVVRPTTLTSDLKIYLNGNLVRTINTSQLASIQRNKIYNLGTLSTPSTPLEKVLFFDFSVNQSDVDPSSGWPTAKNSTTSTSNQTGGMECSYWLYGTEYKFTLADCSGASGKQIFWSHTQTYGHRIVYNSAERYLGTPAINGYKLTHVQCVSSRLDNTTASETLEPKMGIVSNIVATKETPTYVTGGDLQTWAAGNNHESYDYQLEGTAGNTKYYIYAKVKGAIRSVKCTYVPI